MRKSSICLLLCVAAVFLCCRSWGQSLRSYELTVGEKDQREYVDALAGEITAGRATGTEGKMLAERFIVGKFKEFGLKPYNWNFTQSFRHDTVAVRNVVGLIPASVETDEYIIVGAHYDHLGRLGHSIYPGADDNASGVACLISLAKMFSEMKADGRGPHKNIIFVAFDGKEMGMLGSDYFVKHLGIPRSRVTAMVNIDMIGTDLVPPHRGKSDYLIALGEHRLPEVYRGYLSYICSRAQYRLDLDQTFYGSANFSKYMYESGDQMAFSKAGIPAVLFTSAFHKHTYKTTDKPDIINYPLMLRRTRVIFLFVRNLCGKA